MLNHWNQSNLTATKTRGSGLNSSPVAFTSDQRLPLHKYGSRLLLGHNAWRCRVNVAFTLDTDPEPRSTAQAGGYFLLRYGAKTVVFAPSKQIRNEGAICAYSDGAKPVKKSMVQNLTGEMSFDTIFS